jgi:hypothetical protein
MGMFAFTYKSSHLSGDEGWTARKKLMMITLR